MARVSPGHFNTSTCTLYKDINIYIKQTVMQGKVGLTVGSTPLLTRTGDVFVVCEIFIEKVVIFILILPHITDIWRNSTFRFLLQEAV
jgi:hypothetical protein